MRTTDSGVQVARAACGVLNVATGVDVTPDSLFQLGSITKVWTTSLVMQLVDQGLMSLDAPVHDLLPELRLADPRATALVTVRHLLTHTSGIDGDIFTDTGRGDDALQRFVQELGSAAQLHRPGSAWSYSNAGFCVAGRLVEVLTGGSFERALKEQLLEPLGLSHTVMLPEDALLHRAAVGHFGRGAGGAKPSAVWGLPRAIGPAGLICADTLDVLTWAQAVAPLPGGTTTVLSADSIDAMAAEQVLLPEWLGEPDSWGLGWARSNWSGHRIVGHSGQTIGQSARLQVSPDHGLAVVLLTNGGNTADLCGDLFDEIFAELADIARPQPPPPGIAAHRYAALTGTYERASLRIDIGVRDGLLTLTQTEDSPFVGANEATTSLEMRQVGDDRFVVREPGTSSYRPVLFAEVDGAPALYFALRAFPKVA